MKILSRDRNSLKGALQNAISKARSISKLLGEAANHGGSVPVRIPEFESAREALRLQEEIIAVLSALLAASEIVQFEDLSNGAIDMYSLVDLVDDEGSMEQYYILNITLAGFYCIPEEILVTSPASIIGQNLLGRKQGERISVRLPCGFRQFQIKSFSTYLFEYANNSFS